jgi:endo-1,3-1,4-beta-glycanase ExoK
VAGSGLNAAFFTYIGPVHDRAHHEIDIEVLLRDPGAVTFNTFVDGAPYSGGAEAACFGQRRGVPRLRLHLGARWNFTWFVERHGPPHGPRRADPEPPQKIYTSLWSSDSFPDWMGRSRPRPCRRVWLSTGSPSPALGASCQFASRSSASRDDMTLQ